MRVNESQARARGQPGSEFSAHPPLLCKYTPTLMVLCTVPVAEAERLLVQSVVVRPEGDPTDGRTDDGVGTKSFLIMILGRR